MFIVPASMGVQEAGLIALGALLGVSGPAAVALSLAKRLREIVFGLPVLIGWQWYEGRRRRALAATQASIAAAGQRQLKS